MTSLISDERIQLDNGDVLSMVMHKQQICKCSTYIQCTVAYCNACGCSSAVSSQFLCIHC